MTKTYNDALEWAAQWIEDTLRNGPETNERTIEFGTNMAMTLRAAKLSDADLPRAAADTLSVEACLAELRELFPVPPLKIVEIREWTIAGRDAGAVVCINNPEYGSRVEIRFSELEDAQRLHKTIVEARTTAPTEPSERCGDDCCGHDPKFRDEGGRCWYPLPDNRPCKHRCGWVTIGTVHVDRENETETFTRAVQPETRSCPNDNTPMQSFISQYVRCPKCGYQEGIKS